MILALVYGIILKLLALPIEQHSLVTRLPIVVPGSPSGNNSFTMKMGILAIQKSMKIFFVFSNQNFDTCLFFNIG